MKRRILSLLLVAALLTGLLPLTTASAVSYGTPNGFLKPVSLPLMESRSEGLYEEPAEDLPDPADTGFIKEVTGGKPFMPAAGLMADVGEAPSGAVEIATAEDLAAMTAGTYVLTADIDLSGTDWMPINLDKKNSHVTLDGQGHTISGLHINADAEGDFGLFSYVYGNLTVQNLRLDDAVVTLNAMEDATTSTYGVGALAGTVKGNVTLNNVTAEVDMIRSGIYVCHAGGLVGNATGTVIAATDLALSVSLREASDAQPGQGVRGVGGVFGITSHQLEFTHCYVQADLQLVNTAWNTNAGTAGGLGGAVGHVGNGNNLSIFTDCLLEGTVESNFCTGGFIARNSGGIQAENCVVAANVTGSLVGGYGGYLQNFSTKTVFTHCRYTGSVTLQDAATETYAGGFAGYCATGTYRGCAADIDLSIENSTFDTHAGGFVGTGKSASTSTITACSADVSVSANAIGLLYLGGLVGSSKVTIKDTAVVLDAPNLQTTDNAARVGGLVGNTAGSTIENSGANVNLGLTITGEADNIRMGGLVGFADNTPAYAKCWADGTIDLTHRGTNRAAFYLGGLAGYTVGTMTQCFSGVNITWSYPGSTNGCIGGICGNGGSLLSCWSDAVLATDGQAKNSSVAGLVGESNNKTYRDCTFTGEISGVRASKLGGILGSCQNADFINCYFEGDLEGADSIGGILGYASHAPTFTDCLYIGTCRAPEGGGAAGMVACGGNLSNIGTATLTRCEVYADLYAPGGDAHGLSNISTKAYDCTFRGTVSGARMAGIGNSGSFYDCTATVYLDADQCKEEYLKAGGIACSAAVASNCHVTNPLSLYVAMHEDRNNLRIHYGGISGSGARFSDCTAQGVSLNCTGDDHELDEDVETDSFNTYVGGIVGEMISGGMEDCHVSGGVNADGHIGTLRVGGLAGSASSGNKIRFSGCSASGAFGSLTRSTVYAGGLIGVGSDTTYINGCYGSSGGGFVSDEHGKVYAEDPWVGNGKYETGGGGITIPNRPDERFTILTYYYNDDLSNSTILPLKDATITINGSVIGKTDNSGACTVTKETVGSLAMNITAEKDGYFPATTFATLADGGHVNLYLMKKQPGKIYLTAAQISQPHAATQTERMVEVLYKQNTVSVLQESSKAQSFYFGVDWNDMAENGRTLKLTNADGSHSVTVADNKTVELNLRDYFDPGEKIYLQAEAIRKGDIVKERALLGLEVLAVRVNMDVPGGSGSFSEGKAGGFEILDKVGVKLDLDDLSKLDGAKVSYSNGTLTIEVSMKEESKEKAYLLMDRKFDLKVDGKAKIPFTEEADGKWSGTFRVAINGELKNDSSKNVPSEDEKKNASGKEPILDWTFPTHIGPVPVSIIIGFDGSLYSELGLSGEFDKVTYTGVMGLKPSASVKLRAGGEVTDDLKFYVDGGGEMEADFKLELKQAINHEGDSSFAPDMELEGRIFAAVTAKGGELIDISAEKNLGRFTWNRVDGATWYNMNGDTVWQNVQYASLMGASGFDSSGLYAGIQNGSSAAVALEDGIPVLYFTAGDGSGGTVSSSTALWRSVRNTDGTWSQPETVSNGGYPDEVHAANGYVVWVESRETGSLNDLLTTTDLKIAKNGELLHTIDGGGYIYAPEIAADANGNLLVIWLSDPAVTAETFLTPSGQTLQYARYDAAADAWTTGTVKTTGTPVSTALTPGDTETIYTSNDEGTLYRITGSTFGTRGSLVSGLEGYATYGAYAAIIGEDGTITILNKGDEEAVLVTGTASVSSPVICEDGEDVYVIWAQDDGVYYASSRNWTLIHRICEETSMGTRLSAAVVDGRVLVSYYRSTCMDEQVITDLVTAYAEDFSGVDLVLSNAELDTQNLEEQSILRIVGDVENHMETTVSGYAYYVTNELGEEVTSGEVLEELIPGTPVSFYIPIGHDITQTHTYTLELLPLDTIDANEADNTVVLSTTADLALAGTSFRETTEGTGMEILVKNMGTAPSDGWTVRIYEADLTGAPTGTAILTEPVDNLSPTVYRQILMDGVESGSYYLVSLCKGETEMDAELLMWAAPEDPVEPGLTVTQVIAASDGTAEVTLSAQSYDEAAQLIFAVYRANGQLLTCDAQHRQTWEDTQTISFDLDPLNPGTYTYAIYVLHPADSIPLLRQLAGTVTVP